MQPYQIVVVRRELYIVLSQSPVRRKENFLGNGALHTLGTCYLVLTVSWKDAQTIAIWSYARRCSSRMMQMANISSVNTFASLRTCYYAYQKDICWFLHIQHIWERGRSTFGFFWYTSGEDSRFSRNYDAASLRLIVFHIWNKLVSWVRRHHN